MKVVERIIETLIRDCISIDDMQFGFMPGRGTTDAIFILRQLQEKHLDRKLSLYFAFVDLEKAFDRVPRKVIWWAKRKLGVEEWLVKLVQAMYSNARSQVRVNGTYSDPFEVKVGVHQGSVLSPLLFIIVLEALSREYRTGCPWELLYADDLVIIASSEEELIAKLRLWKLQMEGKGLRVNMGKTKVMICGPDLNPLKDSGRFPCSVCRDGVGGNSIFCTGCNLWVHKRCSGIAGKLKEDPAYRCPRCLGNAKPIDPRVKKEIYLDGEKLDVVSSFCYLGDSQSPGGGCEVSTATRVCCAWGKFRELLPLLTCRGLKLATRGHLYNTYVRSTMLHASECWAPTVADEARLQRNDRSMIRWICGVKWDDHVSSESLLRKLCIPPLLDLLRCHRLRWYGHVKRNTGVLQNILNLEVQGGTRGRGRPKKSWMECLRKDIKTWSMPVDEVENRQKWRTTIKECMRRSNPPINGGQRI